MIYNKRSWLNPEDSSSTCSIVCFDGVAKYGYENESEDVPAKTKFVEISDCHNKIRIDQSKFESDDEYCDKIFKLLTELDEYWTFKITDKRKRF